MYAFYKNYADEYIKGKWESSFLPYVLLTCESGVEYFSQGYI